ncbi:MAG: helix-turn-helix domain-containing protein [Candidatus Gastranaerophilaceae bacterium]
MDIVELQAALQKLTTQKVNQASFARLLNISTAAMSDRFKNKSKVSIEELEIIQKHFRVKLYVRVDDKCLKITQNSGERQNDTQVEQKSSQFGKRLSELQAKHNFLDREMAKLLDITERTYISIVVGKKQPDIGVLNRIKQNFKVSIDYLLYGD